MVFWSTNGLASAPSLVPAAAQDWLQTAAASVTGTTASVLLVVVAAGAALFAWHRYQRRLDARASARAPAPAHPAHDIEGDDR